jgi:hypothetical protein
MSKKSLKENLETPKSSQDAVDDWDDFEEVDLDEKKYLPDAHLPDSLETVIQKFQKTHGTRYDYSKVDYIGSKKNVTIICREHGEFSMKVTRHTAGSNCPKCAVLSQASKVTKSQDEVLQRFRKTHGDKYDYSKVVFTRMIDKVIVICPEHGEFTPRARDHADGSGCKYCAFKNRTKNIDLTEAKRLLETGLTVAEVSRIIGVSQPTLKTRLEKDSSR